MYRGDKIPKPEFMTRKWVLDQKELKKTHKELAKELHVSDTTFQGFLKDLGFERNYFVNRFRNTINHSEVWALRQKGLYYKEIGDQLGLSVSQVTRILRKYRKGFVEYMECPECTEKTKVIYTRQDEDYAVNRLRRCPACDASFRTTETINKEEK